MEKRGVGGGREGGRETERKDERESEATNKKREKEEMEEEEEEEEEKLGEKMECPCPAHINGADSFSHLVSSLSSIAFAHAFLFSLFPLLLVSFQSIYPSFQQSFSPMFGSENSRGG
jgi:hypothetical protein